MNHRDIDITEDQRPKTWGVWFIDFRRLVILALLVGFLGLLFYLKVHHETGWLIAVCAPGSAFLIGREIVFRIRYGFWR